MSVAMVIRSWITNFIIFLILIIITGCGLIKPSISRTLEIKSLEEITGLRLRALRNVKELTLETEISSKIFITQKTSNYKLEYLKATLNILPLMDSRQTILNLEIIPTGKIIGRSIEFKLDAPLPGRHEFKLKAEAKLRHEFIKVTDKISFPLQVIPRELINYTKPGLIIDSDDEEIRTLASSIAQGEDDLYRVVFKASKWVRENVRAHYDISTLSISQKASWVLENRKGVCDEQTNLFLGLLRSLEIPAKFITGLVSMNFNATIKFKQHAWAEVYFPSVGWVPFDIAYNQLGFIDATHLKLTESDDNPDSLSSYEWASYAQVFIQQLDIRAKIKNETGIITPPLGIKPRVWYGKIEMGSYNVIEATIVNPHKFYVITDIHLQIPDELKTMGKNNKMLLMEPDTKKTVYWIVKPTINMPRRMITTFPIEIISSRGASSIIKFSVAKGQGYTKHNFERLKKAVEMKIKSEL